MNEVLLHDILIDHQLSALQHSSHFSFSLPVLNSFVALCLRDRKSVI